MIAIMLCTAISGVVHIALKYLSREYDILATVAPWFGYIAIGLMALAALIAIFQAVRDVMQNGSHLPQALVCAGLAVGAWIVLRVLGGTYSYLMRYDAWVMYWMIGYAAAAALQLIVQVVKMIRTEVKK